MKERLDALRRAFEFGTPSAFSRFLMHVRSLSPSDKFFAGFLTILVIVTTGVALYHLERQFLIEVPSRGGTLTEGAVGSPRFVNPLLALSDADRDLVALTYAGLMGYDKYGALTGVLAERYEVSEDGKTYTFILRENARFSDGTPVTAEDVVFTVEKTQDVALKSPELPNWSNIVVEAVDARTVRFTLPKAYAPFLTDATLGILPSHIWRDVGSEEFPFSPFMSEPVGAGPFTVSKTKRNKNGTIEQYELVSSASYALGEPYLSRLTFVFFDTNEELESALARGRVESAHSVPGKNALHAPYARVFGVFFNQNKNPLFARLEVRKALSLAINRTKLVDEVLGGFATPLTGPVPSTLIEKPADIDASFSLESARSVLEKGGWVYDEELGVWKQEKGGLELRLTIKTSNVPELHAVAEAISTDLAVLGVPVSLEFFEPNELAQEVIRPREYDALLFGMVIGRDVDLFPFWASSERNDPGLNIALYTNHEVDELLKDMRTQTNPDTFKQNLQKVNDLISADVPALFTHAPDFVYVVPKELKGVILTNIAEPSDRLVSAPFWYRQIEWVWPSLSE